MKILITGCGMLGYDLCRVLDGHEVSCLDIVKPNFDIENFALCDITDFEKTYKIITRINPETVIHTAAWTDVDGAEKDPENAYRLNVLGTRNVALSCQRFDASMVYISSDYVFDGEKKEPYVEFDGANPLSVYGKSKYYGEIIVRQLLNKFFIVRSSWLYGAYGGKNFVKTIYNLSKEKKEIKIVDDQTGSPTYTKDLAEGIKDLLPTGLYGTYHITNSGSCSWYEFAKEIVRLSGSSCAVLPTTAEKLNRPAKRPKNSVLKNFMRELDGLKPLRDWRQALENYMEEI